LLDDSDRTTHNAWGPATSNYKSDVEGTGDAMNRTALRKTRLSLLLVKLVIVTAGGVAVLLIVILWWQDRPLRQAQHRLEQGQPGQALMLVDEFLRRNPRQDRALAIKARALVALGRWTEADRLYRQIGAATTEDLHGWATALLHLQQWAHALPLLERVLQIEPDHADALHEVTACRANLGDVEGALRTAERLAVIPGSEAAAYLQIGTLHDSLGNYESAVESWQRLLEHDPDASGLALSPQEILFAYASSLYNVSRTADALRVLERSLALEQSASGYVLQGRIRSALGDEDPAIESWKTAVRLDPSNQSARSALARVAIQANDPQVAIDWLLPVVSGSEFDSGIAFLLQRAHTLLGDEARAAEWQERAASLRKEEQLESVIKQALRESPLSFWSQVIYAHRFASEGNWGQAEVLVNALVKQAPDEPFVRELAEAVRQRGPPPALVSLPARQF
jgi:tetratricopeptide (TPR) repeat protein